MKKIWKNNQKGLKAGFFAVTVLAVVLLTMTQVLADAEFNIESGHECFTSSATTADIELSGVDNENAAFFIKDDVTYSFSSYIDLGHAADHLTISGSWAAYTPQVYYITLTDIEEDDLNGITGLSDIDSDDNTVTLDTGSGPLVLQVITVIYDPDEPDIGAVMPSDISYTQITLTVDAEDHPSGSEANVSGLAAEAYSFDGGSHWQASNSKTFSSNGVVDIWVQDNAGNIEKTTYTIDQLDDTPPTLTNITVVPDVTHITDPWSQSTTVTVVGASDSQAGLDAKPYSFNGGVSWQSSNSEDFTSNGTVNIRIRDAVGNYTSRTVEIYTVDNIAPTIEEVKVTLIDSYGGWAKTATIEVINAQDQDTLSGLADEPYSFDGGTSWQSGNTFTVTQNDDYTVLVKDAAGNILNTGTQHVDHIDRTPPQITITESSISELWAAGTATVEFTVTDSDEAGCNPASITGTILNGSVSIVPKPGVENVYIATITGNADAVVEDIIKFTASDNLSNENAGVFSSKNILIDNTDPVISIDESTISNNWAVGTATVELTVTDSGVGYDASAVAGTILNGSVSIVPKPGVENVYIATITGNTDAVVNTSISFTASDTLSNSNTGVSSIKPILIDNTDPVINIDELTISNTWSAASTSFEFTASDTGSRINTISGSVANGHVAISDKPGFADTYIATVTANSGSVVEGKVELTVADEVSHTTTGSTIKDVKADDKDPTLTDLTVQKISGSANPNVVKDGDIIKVSFRLTDAGSGVNPGSVVVTLNGSALHASNTGDVYSCSFTAGSGFTAADDSLLRLTKIEFADNVGNSVTTAQDTDTAIKYYSGIANGFSDLKFWSSNPDSTIAKNGDTVFVSFFTTHPVNIESGTISQSLAVGITWLKQNDTAAKSGCYYSEGCFKVANDTAYDMQNIKLAFTLGDAAENSVLSKTQADSTSILYYAPMAISGVTIVSNNSQDAAQYAKNGDTVIVSFSTNHDVSVSSASIAGKAVTPAKTDGSGSVKNWVMSYTIANGDLGDLAVVPFSFTISDKAGNDQAAVNNGTAGVLHTLRYYAPITAATSIASNYKYSNYAKNSDTVTVTAKTNHAATIVSSAIFGRKASNTGSGSPNLKMSYQIPSGEGSIAEGTASLNYTVSDAAGNTLTVNKTNDAAGSSVTYDRTNPTVSIDPSSLSFSASTVTYTVIFEDEHLSGQDISVMLNGKEQLTSRDRSSVSGTRYTKAVALDTDGNYKLVASLLDSAGNASDPNATTSVTVDMTKPEIKAVKLDISTPKAFKAGFFISDYFEFVDQNIRDIICTVSDSEGTRDWDINEPLTGDGKKTINLIVTDMADNSSTSITYDLYIDGTAPKPVIIDTQSQTAVSSDQPSTFISEMELSISLESLQLGDIGSADRFTKLELHKGGTLYADLLNTIEPDENGVYSYTLNTFGEYNLILSAVDDVGNETGELEYHFFFNDKNIFQKFYENTPLFVTVISILVIGIAALITARIVKRNRKSNTANSI